MFLIKKNWKRKNVIFWPMVVHYLRQTDRHKDFIAHLKKKSLSGFYLMHNTSLTLSSREN